MYLWNTWQLSSGRSRATRRKAADQPLPTFFRNADDTDGAWLGRFSLVRRAILARIPRRALRRRDMHRALCRLHFDEVNKADQDAQDAKCAMDRASNEYAYRYAEGMRRLALARVADARDRLIRHKREHH
jgi:hypothetical protein